MQYQISFNFYHFHFLPLVQVASSGSFASLLNT